MHLRILGLLALCCLAVTKANEPPCGCSGDRENKDLSKYSPYKTYTAESFPWLCRVMHKERFVGSCAILNNRWVITSFLFVHSTDNLQVCVDMNFDSTYCKPVDRLVSPDRNTTDAAFGLMHLTNSLQMEHSAGTTCGICLPAHNAYFYGDIILPSYLAPVGYCCEYSTKFFQLRRARLDCCYHENTRCEEKGKVCSSDLGNECESLGCQGLIGAPLVYRKDNRFILAAVMTDILGCEKCSSCSNFDQISAHSSFLMATIAT